jgi:putative protease
VVATVEGDSLLEIARTTPTSTEVIREKIGQLGETPFVLRSLVSTLPEGVLLPLSSLKRARRAMVDALIAASAVTRPTTQVTWQQVEAALAPSTQEPLSPGLFVLCRNLAQAEAALDAGATGVYLDFLELTGLGAAVRALRARPVRPSIAVAPPRIRKPGEDKIDHYLSTLEPDALLVRGLGALFEGARDRSGTPRIGDFSLNVTNRISATEVLSRGLRAFTPSFDLDATQLVDLLSSTLARHAEVVIHHPMPLFHMEHCVIAALLSDGKDHLTCGRPCEQHKVSLRDRAGLDHPVEADVGCRNTVFHVAAQSAAGLVGSLQRAGVGRFRIELVRETRDDVTRIVQTYLKLLRAESSAADVWRTLRTEGGYGVVRGSLRVLHGG